MPLRNQPYLPLYVQDFLTDEKLIECSAQATGVYIRLMCIMHKSEPYGTILLKQKDNQNGKQTLNFAYKLAKYLPYDLNVIESSLDELISEGVLILEGEKLYQKRMIKDSYISDERAKAGSKGGQFAQAKPKAKSKAKPENEDDIEIITENETITELVFPFSSENFKEVWSYWKEYKLKEYRFKYKTLLSEQAALKSLGELSCQDEETALLIIQQSIANGWQGFFELKDTKHGKKSIINGQSTMQNIIADRDRKRKEATSNG